MAKESNDMLELIKERAKVFDLLSESEKKAYDELLAFIQKSIDNADANKKTATAESNEFERQYTSFLALAISFIIAGLLSSPPTMHTTLANRVFYFASICTASIAAVFLFLEYRIVSKHFDNKINKEDELLDYIYSNKWESPDQLNKWIKSFETKDSRHSSPWVLRTEVFLVSMAFISLACWLIEVLFNPNWPIF